MKALEGLGLKAASESVTVVSFPAAAPPAGSFPKNFSSPATAISTASPGTHATRSLDTLSLVNVNAAISLSAFSTSATPPFFSLASRCNIATCGSPAVR